MGSPVLWGPNNYANNLQNAELTATGALLAYNGPKNYITYGNFENQLTTGWSLGTIGTLTNGLPTGSPTFGSGASGNLSIAIVTSGQLSGTASLSYVSSAATTAGNMLASQSYAIDVEDQAKVLGFKFSYSAISNASNANWSGTSSNSFGVAVYDVTNSAFLGVAGAFNLVQSSGTGIATGTFQTASNTASIRFIIYNVNATSGAITLYFDSFQVGPQVTMQAPAMSDWISYTPTGSWIANTTYSGKWRRVGDSAEIQISLTLSGAPTATTLTLNLPTSLVIDYTKLAIATGAVPVFGQATGVHSGTFYNFAVLYNSTSSVSVSYTTATSGTLAGISATAPVTWVSTDTVTVDFLVPISGWSSNSVSSSDTATNVVAFSATGTANTAFTTTPSIVQFNTVNKDTAGAYSSGTYTIPVTGFYQVNAALDNATSFAAANGILLNVTRNGSNITSGYMRSESAVSSPLTSAPTVAATYLYNAGDTLTITAAGISTSFTATSGIYTYLNISRVSGPAVITATESVNARYTNSSGQSIPNNSATTITGWVKDFDSHAAFSTSGIYTVPVSGKYIVSFELIYASASVVAATQYGLYVTQAGSQSRQITVADYFPSASTTAYTGINGTILVGCFAGDTLTVQGYQSSGGARSLLADQSTNIISFVRVGN